MSNVIDIFSRKQIAESDTEENLEQTETDFAADFVETIKANKLQKERLVKDRIKHNKKTFRQYKIKPKGD